MDRRTHHRLMALAFASGQAPCALQRSLQTRDLAPREHGGWVRRVARVFTALFVAQTLLSALPAYAQVVATPGAPAGHKPLIDAAANGVPIVLIAPPSKAGVSRNQYEQFNVGTKGLILNNSTGAVQTQIGGWITGNLQLGQTPARVILNEVTGTGASQLRGTIEVGGRRADIVIANPNGITCDGCGFLNATEGTVLVVEATAIDNGRGVLASASGARLDAGTGAITNEEGLLQTAGTLQMKASALRNRAGTVATAPALALSGMAVDNRGGTLQSEGALSIDIADRLLDNTGGTLQAGAELLLRAGEVRNASGMVRSAGAAGVQAATLQGNDGAMLARKALTLQVDGAMAVERAQLASEATLTVRADALAARAATLQAGGAGNKQGSAQSTTRSGVSGIAGNTAVRSTDPETGIQRIFDKDKVQKDVDAQVAITQEFGKSASKLVGEYAGEKAKELKNTDPAEAAKWEEGGAYRVALHTVVGGLGGGLSGALGSAASSAAAPTLNDLQGQLTTGLQGAGLSPSAAKAIAGLAGGAAAATLGAVAGGGSATGAAAGFNADMNNRQLHPAERQRVKELAAEKARADCRGSADCERQANLYWTDILERVATGKVDAQEANKNQIYLAQIINLCGQSGTEAFLGGSERFIKDLTEAERLLESSVGRPILDARGNQVSGTDGKPQTYFSATQAQRVDPYGNIFPGGSPDTQASVIPGREKREQARLENLQIRNGAAIPVYPVEEILLGGAIITKGASAVRTVLNGQSLTVYRVEGLPNTRLAIGQDGSVAIKGEQTLFLNFGSRERAEEFLLQRIGQGVESVAVKSFQVERRFFDEIKQQAVPENLARQFPGRPILVDTTKASNQFGLRPDQFRELIDSIIPGSGKNGS